MLNYTTNPQNFEISSERMQATQFAGLIPIARILDSVGFLSPFFSAVEEASDRKPNAVFSATDLVRQRLFALIAGFGDLNDHDLLAHEPGFQSACGSANLASSSCLCRHENSSDRHDIDALNASILNCFIESDKSFGLLRKPKPGRQTCLFLDVDSTHVDLYGNQENKSYNAHYQTNCLAPCLCYLNGWPVAVFNAAGTKDARKVLEPQFHRLVSRIVEAFPKYRIVLRADSGFNSQLLMETCNSLKIHYITGFSPNKAAQKAALTGIVDPVIKLVRRYTAKGSAWRKLGELVGYQAKSWKTQRRLIARKQFDPRTNQMDLRLIQTSIKYTKDKNDPGYCGELSAVESADLYETVYCARGNMEQDVGEFKGPCFGARASATRFLTNSFRMSLAMICQLVLKVMRKLLLRGLLGKGAKKKDKSKKRVMMTVAKFRQTVINVCAQLKADKEKVFLILPEFMLDEEAFLTFFNLRTH